MGNGSNVGVPGSREGVRGRKKVKEGKGERVPMVASSPQSPPPPPLCSRHKYITKQPFSS